MQRRPIDAVAARKRLEKHTRELLDGYKQLLHAAQVGAAREDEQVGELQVAVATANLLQSAENLTQLSFELERASLLGDHAALRAEVDASIARHTQAESEALAKIAAPRDG